MQRIRAISDEEIGFELEIEGKVITILATEAMVYWDDARVSGPNATLQDRYDNFAHIFGQRIGVTINRGTSYLIMEEALKLLASLKKTLSQEASLKCLELEQKADQQTS